MNVLVNVPVIVANVFGGITVPKERILDAKKYNHNLMKSRVLSIVTKLTVM